jgi:hypothetical protein
MIKRYVLPKRRTLSQLNGGTIHDRTTVRFVAVRMTKFANFKTGNNTEFAVTTHLQLVPKSRKYECIDPLPHTLSSYSA